MPTVELDPSIAPVEVEGFRFPLGVYPIEPLTPTPGYVEEFEQADGGPTFWTDDGPAGDDWEEWPDRFMYDIVLSADRMPTLMRAFLSLLPAHVYPILDVLGNDAYREVDPYIAYEPVGVDRVFDALRSFGPWLYEDGLVGFGAMSLEPFCYAFVDEHKILTVRVEPELKERAERALGAFGLTAVGEIRGADAAAHEHRGVLVHPSDTQPNVMTAEEIVDRLRRHWNLQLNIDRTTNLDDDGTDLGRTYWRGLIRCIEDEDGPELFAEVVLIALSLDEAVSIAGEATMKDAGRGRGVFQVEPLSFDRLTPEGCAEVLGEDPPRSGAESKVLRLRWLGQDEPSSAS
ncbi:MAG: hypothetical protein AAGI30_06290 [Planctomycetota bacterium]